MITNLNRLTKNKALTSAELSLTVAAVLAFGMSMAVFVPRQAADMTRKAAEFSMNASGVGAYEEAGFAPADKFKELNKTSFGTDGLDVAPGELTMTADMTDNSNGQDNILPSQ